MDRIWKMPLLIVTIIIADQLTKGAIQDNLSYGEVIPVIDGLLNIVYVKNSGAAFGMGANSATWVRVTFFLILPVIACIWLLWAIWKTREENFIQCLAYSLVLGGAIGNLIDRFSLGYVVDMIDFYYKSSHFAAFNIADSAITVAAFLLIYDFYLESKRNKEEKLT